MGEDWVGVSRARLDGLSVKLGLERRSLFIVVVSDE